jgi:CubicO group peptidase (beta-lactamase class C family)
VTLAVSAFLLTGGCGGRNPVPDPCPREGNTEIADALESILRRHRLPAMGAAIVSATGDVEIAVVGVKKAGSDVPVTLEDRWHIGSCGKAMNATVVARLVERGQLRWDTTVREVFAELAEAFETPLGSVTLAQLLSHRAGLERNLDYAALARFGPPRAQRLEAVREAGRMKLLRPPGAEYVYSNLGYAMAGAIVEETVDRP